jgi:hypothetical protein
MDFLAFPTISGANNSNYIVSVRKSYGYDFFGEYAASAPSPISAETTMSSAKTSFIDLPNQRFGGDAC